MVSCPNCGTKNLDNSKFCENCGAKLDEPEIKDVGEDKKPSTAIIVLGYLFAFLGGLIGIAIGAYLYTRKNSHAKSHGRNMLIIGALIMIVSFAASPLILNDLTTPVNNSSNSTSNTSASKEGIQIIKQNASNWEYQGAHWIDIRGEAQNNYDKTVNKIRLGVIGYDSDGKEVARNYTYCTPFIVSPGAKVTFTLTLKDPDKKIVKYDITVDSFKFEE